jgi:hypothetical protein
MPAPRSPTELSPEIVLTKYRFNRKCFKILQTLLTYLLYGAMYRMDLFASYNSMDLL